MLSEEEKKAIDIIKYNDIGHPLACGDLTICSIEDLQIVLNVIEKQDKIIYEIAKAFKQDDIRSIEEIIEYFTNKVKKENKNDN